MREVQERYAALLSIAVKSIFAFGVYSLIFIGMRISYISLEGTRIPADIIIVICIFLCIGALIIWSAFSKIAFYILSAAEALILLIFFLAWPIMIIFFGPEIYYYVSRMRAYADQ